MKTTSILVVLTLCYCKTFSQHLLTSWSQQNIENYTEEMYNEAQKLSSSELLLKNLSDKTWSAVFLTLNASVNNYSKDNNYLKELANQISINTECYLEGTSRLIIWDRIISGDITFEGKGLVIDNDLYKVAGRANQILQNSTNKNFGFVTIRSGAKELDELKGKWLIYLSNKPVDEFNPIENKNAKIPEISNLTALQALIISLQDNSKKQKITKNCLKKVYNLDDMPLEKGSPASYCNPDTYTFSYLGILFGHEKFEENKDMKWWMTFWEKNHGNLVWNNDKGIYQVKK